MNYFQHRFGFLIFLTFIFSLLIVHNADAIWMTLLEEHFDKDQWNPNLQWPWVTHVDEDQFGHEIIRWWWNPQPPHRRTTEAYTDYSWGLQDNIYNVRVDEDDEQALWCAYTNGEEVNNPQWPEDEDYLPNTVAWTAWGPIDLSQAAGCKVSFWTYVDLTQWRGDSLCVGVFRGGQDGPHQGDEVWLRILKIIWTDSVLHAHFR